MENERGNFSLLSKGGFSLQLNVFAYLGLRTESERTLGKSCSY